MQTMKLNKKNEVCVYYMFASLFCMSKGEHLRIKEKCFSFHFETSYHSREDQILTFQVFKSCDVIKKLETRNMKHILPNSILVNKVNFFY